MENQTNKSKKLYRSRTERIFAGVCGGLANFFDADPTLVRVIFVLLALINGIGVILYLAMMIIIPKEPLNGEPVALDDRKEKIREFVEEIKTHAKSFKTEASGHERRQYRRNIIGILLIIFGFLFLLERVIPIRFMNWSLFWPLILVVIGFSILFHNMENK